MIRDGRRLLARIPLFAPFEPADLDALFSCAYDRSMHAGETLFQQGDPGISMMAILAGEVRIVLPSESGQDQVLNVLTQGSVFGEIALFDGKPRSADAVAATNGRLLVIERAATMRLMERDPGFAHRVVEIICARLRATIAQLDSMVFQDVTQRLAAYLLQRHDERGLARVDITQNALGRVVGSARETVNRRLRDLEGQGMIALSPGRITIIDRKSLAALVSGVSRIA
ncbi:MAG: Crp/Fnr family transcriptional regulator [Acidiphilium sp.]|nr:Crp/Fnr family transcriptional regulator [Acidiphilium sp.]MDD4935444.1 Crp/Fnr family transcriptional regulator [Acidiphilium sp.]